MAISELRDIRKETRDYIDNQVQVDVQISLEPGQKVINVGDTFTVNFTVQNSPGAPLKRIRLKDVRYHVLVDDSKIAQIAANPKDYDISGTPDALLLRPKDPAFAVLDAFGKFATLNPPSINGMALKQGTTKIFCHIHAEPDLDFLFPKNARSTRGKVDMVVKPLNP